MMLTHWKTILFAGLGSLIMTFGTACKRGCMEDVPCVGNFSARAEKEGNCTGCTVFGAYNYCPEADQDNGTCLFTREFYTDVSSEGWVDVWVADSANSNNTNQLRYSGRITAFPSQIPNCELSDSSLTVLRSAGEYYYEIETETGNLEWGWVIYREEGCRLFDVL